MRDERASGRTGSEFLRKLLAKRVSLLAKRLDFYKKSAGEVIFQNLVDQKPTIVITGLTSMINVNPVSSGTSGARK